jgi:F0F1-type ATP synthase epsilon subunit
MLAGIAQTVVFAAEKIFGAKMGEDKLSYALKLAQKLLSKKHLTFDEDVVRAAIEEQVKQLKLKEQEDASKGDGE